MIFCSVRILRTSLIFKLSQETVLNRYIRIVSLILFLNLIFKFQFIKYISSTFTIVCYLITKSLGMTVPFLFNSRF